jgi:putative flippase GtrA
MTTVTKPVPPRTASGARWPARLIRLARAAATSVAATALSQGALLAVLTAGGAPALASAVAFSAGALLNFLVTRRWVWGRTGRPRVRHELLPYLAVIAFGGLVSVSLTALAGHLLAPLTMPHALWVVLIDGAYVAAYALVFLVKFTLLDRLVFGPAAGRIPATTSRS